MSGVCDGWVRVVVPAGRACHDSGDTQPKILNKELRQAWDGAWYPLVAQEGEPSFSTYYGDSAEHVWELCASCTRKAVIMSLFPEPRHTPLQRLQDRVIQPQTETATQEATETPIPSPVPLKEIETPIPPPPTRSIPPPSPEPAFPEPDPGSVYEEAHLGKIWKLFCVGPVARPH